MINEFARFDACQLAKQNVRIGSFIIAPTMRSHTVPRFLLDRFAYYDHVRQKRRLWQYTKGRHPWGFASPKTATRVESHFLDPSNAEREHKTETRLNDEFENPVHCFLEKLQYRTFVLSRLNQRQLTRYITLLFNRSQNRRNATKDQIAIAIESTRSFLADKEKLSRVAARWTLEIIRSGHPLQRAATSVDVQESLEKMIAMMQSEHHQQTTYVDSIERSMSFLDDAMDCGQWNIMHTSLDIPFVIGDAPVVTWQRLASGTLLYGKGFSTPDVEVVLPVASTTCLHILPLVPRTLRVRQPTVREVNEAQAAFSSRYCYAHKEDLVLNEILQNKFGKSQIGINAFSVRHRNYENTMYELFMSGGTNFSAPVW